MELASLLPLIHNAALLLAMVFIYDLFAHRQLQQNTLSLQIGTGLVLGLIGMIIMLTPWVFETGIIFDTRSVLLGISGLFFGTVPTLLAMGITASLRISQGGAAFTGVAVILASGVIGIAWRQLRWGELSKISLSELYVFGLLIHAVMLGLMFTLPWDVAIKVLSGITVPVLLVYPLATMLLGILFANRLQREELSRHVAQSEFLFRSQFDLGNMGIAITGPDQRWQRVNPRLCEMLGYTEQELYRLTWSELTYADDLHTDLQQFQRLMAGEIDSYELDKRYIRKDGSILYTHLTIACHRVNGAVKFFVAGILDFSESNRIEAELRASNQQLTRILASGRHGSWDWDLSTDRFQHNERLAEIVQVLPQQLHSTGNHLLDYIHPQDRQAVWQSINNTLQGLAEFHLQEYRLRSPSGQSCWVLECARVVERNAQGQATRMCGTLTDITPLKAPMANPRQVETA